MFAASKTAGVTSGGGPPPSSSDPQFNYVSLLLNDTGTNGQQNNTFLDSSSNNFTITRNGTPTQGSVTPYWPNGQWSNYFGGSQFLTAPSNAAFGFGTGDFTIETWAYFAGVSTQQNFIDLRASAGGTAPILYITATGVVNYSVGGAALISSASNAVPANTWNHIALSRSSGSSKIFVNGTQVGSTAADSTNFGTTIAAIGGVFNSTNTMTGYLSNVRIVKGTAVYTSAFTPSTTPLTAVSGTSLLTCQSNRFRDASSNNFAITVTGTPSVQRFSPFDPAAAYSTSVIGGSGYFNGTSDYVTAPNSAALQLSNGNFTIEFWFYATNLTGARQFLNTDISVPNTSYAIVTSGTTCLYYLSSTGTTWNLAGGVSAGTVTANTWNHLALVRNGATVTPYINGVAGTTTSVGTTALYNFTSALGIAQASSQYFAGYLSNLRIVKGTAVYTANFTPPTAPLTAITNTSLLLNCVNAGIYDNAMMNDLVTVGDAQVSTAVKKYGTGSMAFDGTGDYLTTITTPNLQFGTGDFTVEFWLYFIARDTLGACIFANYNNFTTGALSFFAGHNTGSATKYQVACNGTFPAIQSTATVTYNQWDHFAIVRSGSTLTLYINGVADGTFSVSGITLNGVGSNWIFGAALDALTNYELNGYIDDLRITKGVARYTANFTPPTAAFPNL